ncbi:MAG: mechanosensitive ion channel family protein [Deltaproteobacteria bacterium]
MEKFYESLKINFLDKAITALTEWGPNLVLAIVTLLGGLWLIKIVMRSFEKFLENRSVDNTLKPFLITLITFLLKMMLFLAVAGQIGIKTTSFIAVLGAAGLAIGLAMQGALGNFAAGVLILVFRPFKVGDFIESQGILGKVKEVSVFVTVLETNDLKTVILPNGPLLGGNISNYSQTGNLRAEIKFLIHYGDDFVKARQLVTGIMKTSNYALKNPEPMVVVSELSNYNIECTAMVYVLPSDYFDAQWYFRGEIVRVLEEAGFRHPHCEGNN